MKRIKNSYTGSRPVFTGSPSLVPGGYNLDVTNQSFRIGDVIPAGSLALVDESARTVKILKTAKVVSIDAENAKVVNLQVAEFFAPLFVEGESVLKAGAISGTFANAPTITKIVRKPGVFQITLSAAISGLAVGDVLEQVVASSNNAAEIGTANRVTVTDTEVEEFETAIDVCADTMQYALFENRVAPIPASQKSGEYLAGNAHIRLTKAAC